MVLRFSYTFFTFSPGGYLVEWNLLWRQVDHLWGINAVQCTAGRYMTEVSAEAMHKIRKEERSKKDRKRGTENFSADSGLRFKT